MTRANKNPTKGQRHVNPHDVAYAACAFEIQADGSLQLFPAGKFTAPKGSMAGQGPWFIDQAVATRVIARVAALTNDMLVDYEHQSLLAVTNGKEVPAAGWLKRNDLEWREGQGLYAVNPEWTARAKQYIDQKEYRYLSPVFTYDRKTGEVLDLISAALTNTPAIDGMDEIARAAAKFLTHHTAIEEETSMEELLKLFGLEPTATEEDAIAALKALQEDNTSLKQQVNDKDAAIAAAKAQTPETAVAAMRGLQEEVAALKTQIDGKEKDDLVTAALQDGKLIPAQEAWARELDVAALKAYLDVAQPIAALKGKQTDKTSFDEEGNAILSDEQLAVCKQMDIDPAEFKKTLKEDAA